MLYKEVPVVVARARSPLRGEGVPATTGTPVLNEETPTLSAPHAGGTLGRVGPPALQPQSVAADPSVSLPPAPVHSPQLNEECTVRGKGTHNRESLCLTNTAAGVHPGPRHVPMVLESSPFQINTTRRGTYEAGMLPIPGDRHPQRD